jgi:predicted NAD/FAD-dependent oxidoreductase
VPVPGAGPAALSTARTLQAAGLGVTGYVAQDGIAGRIRTPRRWRDLPGDMDASQIHGTRENPLTELDDKAGAGHVGTTHERALPPDAIGRALDIDRPTARAETLVTAARAAAAAEAHAALRAMSGSAIPAAPAARVTRGPRDPLEGGSCWLNAAGPSATTRAAPSGHDRTGRLVFAGETARPDVFGTAHGARLSGLASAGRMGAPT